MSPPTPRGWPSASAATTPARSASCRACAARSATDVPARSWPRSRPWSPTASSRSRCWARTSTPTGRSSASATPSPTCCGQSGPFPGSSGSGSPHRTHGTSPARSSRPWLRHPRSCPRCTCPCSPAATRSCARCAGPIAATGSCRSSTKCGRPSPQLRSPRTSSSDSRGSQRRTSSTPSRLWSVHASVLRSPSSTRPAPARRQPRWTTRSRRSVVQERYERLVETLERISWEENLALVGTTTEVLVAEGEGRKDEQTRRMSGRARDGRLVHFSGADSARPGDCVTVRLDSAAPHHLTGTAASIRTTRAGDAWAAGQTSCSTSSSAGDSGVLGPVVLGMPGLRPVG